MKKKKKKKKKKKINNLHTIIRKMIPNVMYKFNIINMTKSYRYVILDIYYKNYIIKIHIPLLII